MEDQPSRLGDHGRYPTKRYAVSCVSLMPSTEKTRTFKIALSVCVALFFLVQFGWIVAAHTIGGIWIFDSAAIVGAILPLVFILALVLTQASGLVRFSGFANLSIILTTGFSMILIWSVFAMASAAV
ncbi:hypothetical protein N9B60_02615 [Mariniblastus sp.]|nr:hypothetical protein [Mariniblastus sp.]MDB4380028.1 hypothetical protein [Mariniblastus sp.]MDB4460171.1 hypothetical protein [bacterium]MDB4564618.1 hypothetical protein [Mariniblastus sp.]